MNDMQFEIITDLAALNPQHIETNFDDVRDWLSTVTRPYATLIVTEDAISDAKKDLAKLRKVKEQIEVQRKAVKKEWMKPYEEFERDKAKVLTGILDEAISNIDGQVKDYDARRKEQKMAELKEYFTFEAQERGVLDYLDWEKVKNHKWANASVSVDAAQSEIFGIIDNCAIDLGFIRGKNSPFEAPMLEEYRRTLNLRDALAVETRLKAVQEAEERKKAEAVAETFKEQENESDGSTAPFDPVYEPQQTFIRRSDEEEPPKPKLYTVDFRVVMTMQQAHALKAFFTEQGIEYKKIG